jgi:hypothetical protein
MSNNKEFRRTNMVRTLRITTIIAALLTVGFLVFSAVFGARGDKAIEEFLKSPAAIEGFQHAKGQKAGGENQTSPLVKQAQAFALYLNPPPPPPPIVSALQPPPQPKVVTPKFKLIGTSFYPLHPDLSLALIDEPGKGIRWVRQLGQIGHLAIEQIKDGVVVVSDGGRTFEVAAAERLKKVNLVKSSTLDETGAKAASLPVPPPTPPQPEKIKSVSAAPAEANVVSPTPVKAAEQIDAEPNTKSVAEKAAALEEILRNLNAAKAGAGSTEEEKKGNDELEKFIESIRVSAEETEKLDKLGEDLQNGGAEPNLVEGRSGKVEHRP